MLDEEKVSRTTIADMMERAGFPIIIVQREERGIIAAIDQREADIEAHRQLTTGKETRA
jgi:hypothetical protein